MSEVTVSLIVLCCVFGATLIGLMLRAVLPVQELDDLTKDAVRLGMGFVATMAALVIGLMLYSAKGSYEDQRGGIDNIAASLVLLDATLAQYGPPGDEARQSLRDIVGRMIEQLWPVDDSSEPTPGAAVVAVGGEFFTQLLSLAPANETQQLLKSQALQIAVDLARERQLLVAQRESRGLSVFYIVVVVIWLAVLFGSFGLFARPNTVVVISLFLCAFSISAGIMLTLELDQPFGGLIKVSSTPLEHVYENLGH